MVNSKGLFITIISLLSFFSVFSQNCSDFTELEKYHNFGISIGGRIYRKGETIASYGNYKVQMKNPITYSFGCSYELFTANKWSVKSALNFAKPPFDKSSVTILQKDINPAFGRDLIIEINEFSKLFVSIPLICQFKFKLFSKNYLSFNAGGIAIYHPYSSYEFTARAIADGIAVEVYKLRAFSTSNFFHGGLTTGCSYYLDLNKILFEFRFTYTAMFQNIFQGEYQFGNLLVSPPTRGLYKMSGDYLEFSIATHFLKFKKRKK
jgi:hypothetical protein